MTEAETEANVQQLLFNRWDMSEVEIRSSLARYVNLHTMIVPHTCGNLPASSSTRATC